MSAERTLTFDELVDALTSVGDGPGGCEFSDPSGDNPDHHGPEFATAIWESIERDRAIVAEMLRRAR